MSKINKKIHKKNPCKFPECSNLCCKDFCNHHGLSPSLLNCTYDKCINKCRPTSIGQRCHKHNEITMEKNRNRVILKTKMNNLSAND